jgi:hypothetical protein
MEIPENLITFQVMRWTLGSNLQHHGTLKDAQGALRHASIRTTGDVYGQTIEKSVLSSMNSRTLEIHADWKQAILNGKRAAVTERPKGGEPSRSKFNWIKS